MGASQKSIEIKVFKHKLFSKSINERFKAVIDMDVQTFLLYTELHIRKTDKTQYL